ncbi:small rab-related GTPase [Scenedesmus sp. NREL 46B-D3]|nr:small rab-related GTPase [Scenedesmus sp. NREL 46B-D3]
MEDFEREIKVVVVGNGGVGKTSMIKRFCKGIFTDDYKKTIGVDFLEKQLYSHPSARMCSCTSGTLRDRRSLTQSQRPTTEAVVSHEEAEAMARRLGLKFYRTCVKEDLNVTEVFTYLAELHDRKLNSGHLQQGPAMPVLEAGAAAAGDISEPAVGSSYHNPSVTATITLPNVGEQQHRKVYSSSAGEIDSSSGGDFGRKQLPASVQLHPSVQRGKKSVATKLKKKLTKAKFTECSIQ